MVTPARAAGARTRDGAPLDRVLLAAASVWLQARDGQSLERALLPHAAAPGSASTPLDGAVRAVCHDAMRRRALIDAVLQRLMRRPADAPVAALLAAALSQLLDAAYPDYVVVDQAVGATRQDPLLRQAGGFVNAVLRQFLRQRATLVPQLLQDDATRLNVPSWWLRMIRRDHASDWNELLERSLGAPPLTLRVNRRRSGVEDYLARLVAEGIAASRVGQWAVWLHQPLPVTLIPGFREGLVSVQDAGAQLAAPWLDAAAPMRVLDACAAPGGKAGHLAELGDAEVDALELDPQRARRIDENLDRLGLAGPQRRVIVGDAAQPESFWDGRPYDRILLDAPCTGSGIVRRHPDIPWSRRQSDVAQLATLQAALLDALWPLLAPAGRLLYVVCSVFHEEAALQAESFLGRHPNARPLRLPVAEPVRAVALSNVPSRPGPARSAAVDASSPFLQLLPSRVDPGDSPPTGPLPTLHDGFFFAHFEKTCPG